jgi:hypothetical protein
MTVKRLELTVKRADRLIVQITKHDFETASIGKEWIHKMNLI